MTGSTVADGVAEADADRAAGGRKDRRIDADHLAVHIEQRAAGIALIDRRVGLEIIVVGAGIDIAVARRDDAGRHRAAETERIADRDDPVADAHLVAVAEFRGLQRLVRLHAQHCDVDFRIGADHLGFQLLAIGEDDRHVIGVGDDVIVGDDDA